MVAFGTRCICKRNRVCRRCIPSQPWMSALGSRRTCKRRRVCRRSIPSQPWMIAFGSCIILVSHQYHKRGEACRWEEERLKPRVRHALTSNRGRCSRGARNQLLRPNASATCHRPAWELRMLMTAMLARRAPFNEAGSACSLRAAELPIFCRLRHHSKARPPSRPPYLLDSERVSEANPRWAAQSRRRARAQGV